MNGTTNEADRAVDEKTQMPIFPLPSPGPSCWHPFTSKLFDLFGADLPPRTLTSLNHLSTMSYSRCSNFQMSSVYTQQVNCWLKHTVNHRKLIT